MNTTTSELTVIDSTSPAEVSALEPGRVARAKAAYTTRRVPTERMATLLTGDITPHSGDLVLARVKRIRQHTRIELGSGRRSRLYVGDEVVVCYANRYAPDQFEAVVPSNLGACHLVAAGGVAARCLSRSAKVKAPTELEPIGLLGDAEGRRINLSEHAVEPVRGQQPRPFTVAVVGTSMNAGKTTSAASLIHGMTRSGLKVGAAKITGTGAGGDVWFMTDAGAHTVVDFTDAGFASTYMASPREVEGILERLTAHLQAQGVDAVVLEVADGLYQEETAALLGSRRFAEVVDGVVFAAGDAMGAAAGSQWLRRHGLPVLAVTGALTASPLAAREAARATGLPVLDLDALTDSGVTALLAEQVEAGRLEAEAI